MNSWKTKSNLVIKQILSGRSNVFLLTNGEKNILIDTSPKSQRKKLARRLNELGINNIDYLILTHAHFDHAGNAKFIQEKFGARVVIHKSEGSYLSSGSNPMLAGTNIFTKIIIKLFGFMLAEKLLYEPCLPDILINDKFDFNDIGFKAYILHTPGHSPGSMSVIVDDEVAIVGDAMFGVFPWSVFPPYGDDSKLMIKSWGKLLETNCRVFLPSHGRADSRKLLKMGYEKKRSKFD
jgi:glyoxylase-like metal-dependent hydrolase (beta-lactamase superfamily II)